MSGNITMQKIVTKLKKIEEKMDAESNILKIEPLDKSFVKITIYNNKRELQKQIQMLKEDFIYPAKIKELLQNKIIIDLTQTTQKDINKFIDDYFAPENRTQLKIIDDLPNRENVIEYLKEIPADERQQIIDEVNDFN